jgi:hypothetical protein
MAPSASQNASCARANVFLLDEGAPAVPPAEGPGPSIRTLHRRSAQRSPAQPGSPATGYRTQARSLRREQAAGLRVIDKGRSTPSSYPGLQAAAGSAQDDARPGTAKRIRSPRYRCAGTVGCHPAMTQALPLARFGLSGLPPRRRDSKQTAPTTISESLKGISEGSWTHIRLEGIGDPSSRYITA